MPALGSKTEQTANAGTAALATSWEGYFTGGGYTNELKMWELLGSQLVGDFLLIGLSDLLFQSLCIYSASNNHNRKYNTNSKSLHFFKQKIFQIIDSI